MISRRRIRGRYLPPSAQQRAAAHVACPSPRTPRSPPSPRYGARPLAVSARATPRAASRRPGSRRRPVRALGRPSSIAPTNIDRADYFTMLDLARDATRKTPRPQLLRARQEAGTRTACPPELAPVQDACSRVFARMSEAHATLTDDEKRARLHEAPGRAAAARPRCRSGRQGGRGGADFQKAEVCFKRNDLVQAETFCRKALEADADAARLPRDARVAHRAQAREPVAEKTVECIQHARQGHLDERPLREGATSGAGCSTSAWASPSRATGTSGRSVDLNPRNIDAAREVRLHNMRGGPRGRSSHPPADHPLQPASRRSPSEADEKSGLFGRFFKK